MDKDISVDTFRIYLENKGWIKKYCSKCNGIFYTKDINNTVCGRPKTYCSSYDFLKYPRKKCSTKIKYLLDIYNDFIKENSFSKVDAIKIKKTETSLFLGSAGQLFNEEIFEEKTLNDNVFFIAQPVIRLQFANSSDTIKKNYLSSFVNLSSQYLSLQNNINKHIELFEKWLDFFSSAGLYVGHFTLKEKISSKIWKDRKVDSISYFIIYKGLEIGVVNYSIIEQFTRNNIYQSDCTFGLERLLWAVNKTSNILYNIAPDIIILQNNMEFIDIYRTLVLMVGSGIKPANNNQGYKFRMLCKKISNINSVLDIELLRYYYYFWSNFFKLCDFDNIYNIIYLEYSRNINIYLNDNIKKSRINNINNNQNQNIYQYLSQKNINYADFDKLKQYINNN